MINLVKEAKIGVGIISLKDTSQICTLRDIPKEYPVVLSDDLGVGYARNIVGNALCNCGCEILVLLDDDLNVMGELWSWLRSLKQDEFAMVDVNGHLSTRVFAAHKHLFQEVGFDNSLRYVFEDGDFAIRAQKLGYHLCLVPPSLFSHKNHPRNRYKNLVALNWEYCRMFVKYKRHVFNNLFEFFWRPFDYRIKLQDLATKIPFTLYWILRSKYA